MLKRELTANPGRQLGALLAKNAFRTIKRRLDPEVLEERRCWVLMARL